MNDEDPKLSKRIKARGAHAQTFLRKNRRAKQLLGKLARSTCKRWVGGRRKALQLAMYPVEQKRSPRVQNLLGVESVTQSAKESPL